MKYGCIAEKLSHSFSKEIHSYLGDYPYELCEVGKGELSAFFKKRDFLAINVTIPYKQDVIPYLDEISETAERIGAVNTIVNKNGKLYGYNTDFFGMRELFLYSNINPSGKKALVLGSGGTSKTAAAVLESLGAEKTVRVSRTPSEGLVDYQTAERLHSDAEIIVNTTPVGMYPNIGKCPVDLDKFPKVQGVVDAVYNPLNSKLVTDAGKRGIVATGGLYMLVAQAHRASELFLDTKLPREKIEEIYKIIYKKTQNVVLVGMPSSGKSTVGRILARDLSRPFFDTDEEIVKRAKREISDIFKEDGESAFRDMESEVIREISAYRGAVIATGGGAVLREENVDFLRENSRIYFIDRPLENLMPTADRPLAQDREEIKKRYEERYDIYCHSCDCHIRSNNVIADTVKEIKEDFLK